MNAIKVDLLTREYPPFVYGGAGVHVEELSKVLGDLLGSQNLRVRCFDGPREKNSNCNCTNFCVFGYDTPVELLQKTDSCSTSDCDCETHSSQSVSPANPAIQTLGVDLQMANDCKGANIVHSHTWYANFAGFLASKLYGIPHVITAHSLEPLRPWKKEQLGGGYDVSSWVEKLCYENAAAIIAVSNGMRNDILKCYPEIDPNKVKVVYNGVDLASFRLTDQPTDVLERYKIDQNKPTAVFVGRITRQKGLTYFLQAAREIDASVQLVLCAGAPDTPEIATEVADAFANLAKTRGNVVWIEEMLPKHELTTVLNASDVFICPSVYEPLGIVNLEAMALKLPVVATRTGGIPEVVLDGETGILVDIEQIDDGTGTPIDQAAFASDFARAVNEMFSDLDRAKMMGIAGYERAKQYFSWEKIGEDVLNVYKEVIANS